MIQSRNHSTKNQKDEESKKLAQGRRQSNPQAVARTRPRFGKLGPLHLTPALQKCSRRNRQSKGPGAGVGSGPQSHTQTFGRALPVKQGKESWINESAESLGHRRLLEGRRRLVHGACVMPPAARADRHGDSKSASGRRATAAALRPTGRSGVSQSAPQVAEPQQGKRRKLAGNPNSTRGGQRVFPPKKGLRAANQHRAAANLLAVGALLRAASPCGRAARLFGARGPGQNGASRVFRVVRETPRGSLVVSL